MGKVRKTKSYRQHQPAVPVVKEDRDEEDEQVEEPVEDTSNESALSRGQRKRMKRRDTFLKKMGMVQRTVSQKQKDAQKQKDEQKQNAKKKIYGMFGSLEDLQESLFSETAAPAQAAAAAVAATEPVKAGPVKQLTGKQKKRLAMHELGHLKAVHTHPAFQANPFAAIQMHLQNTVVNQNPQPPAAVASKKK
ncbi:Aste57867_10331 [Aphanomyces stellatus]|uniref:Aste57867_10331 protein n=1 Tax=Aphanomyces stellatus TaxID=120398 RepID=A0A485KQK7_9STRA|nr:hypothetical protein As57867_010291 [Aphanomyces stellatus]VFT87205.1 Aste57867_10331 [Aphanomyces stellatus]